MGLIEENIKKVLVAGAGVMGHGLAQSFAQAGYNVSLFSRTVETLNRAQKLIESSLNTMAQQGLLPAEQIPAIMGRIKTTTSLDEGATEADIALETIAENVASKKEIFSQLDKACPPRTLLASNTSLLNIFDFVETSRPGKVLITHWYAPPELIPFVEVVKGPRTDQSSIDTMVNILKKMGKKPAVMHKFIPGFIINRLQLALQRECHYLIDNDYVSPQDFDEAVKYGLALRMMVVGIIQRIDFGGLDLSIKNTENSNVQPVPLDYKPKKLYELVSHGHLGVKSGKGFYDYSGRSEADIYRERDVKLIHLLKNLPGEEDR